MSYSKIVHNLINKKSLLLELNSISLNLKFRAHILHPHSARGFPTEHQTTQTRQTVNKQTFRFEHNYYYTIKKEINSSQQQSMVTF